MNTSEATAPKQDHAKSAQTKKETVTLRTEMLQGEAWFKIENHDAMAPFFMSIVSDSNHWLFMTSNGGITAGRKSPQSALFPYCTDDKIAESTQTTGSKTVLRVQCGEQTVLWEPFSEFSMAPYSLTRNLYKNLCGNRVMFEEHNHDLGLSFRYTWSSSNRFGFVREASLENHSGESRHVHIVDGLQNILPYGVGSAMQNQRSNLVDAYKRSELLPETGIGIFALSAIIVDRAEPSEALRANVVWGRGLPDPTYLLSSLQLSAFREGGEVQPETDKKGVKGAYFLCSSFSIPAKGAQHWILVANVSQNHADIARLSADIRNGSDLPAAVLDDVALGTRNLSHLVASADGLQRSADIFMDTRHRANVLFNIMRGGIPDHNYRIEKQDFTTYLRGANQAVVERNEAFLAALPEVFDLFTLRAALLRCADIDLERLSVEYLPLKFSRRHGDPSRPWNTFSIQTRDEEDGSKVLNYEGNWRDIFQNWEVLAHAYPSFMEGMICKFVNLSTFDGYNPYRVAKSGFDWEVVEPEDPWSFIGYWGDHQIIYLLKFLEFQQAYDPDAFRSLFAKSGFVYANVPYRIKPHADIVRNPKDTIEFDKDADKHLREQVSEKGTDAALLQQNQGGIHRVGFTEKILASLLAKVSNLIPEAGIWLNTQRPEWNDANNALVGNGVSMVTLYYLHRFLKFFEPVFQDLKPEECEVSVELADFFTAIHTVLGQHAPLLAGPFSDTDRRKVVDALGTAASQYRTGVYTNGFSGNTTRLHPADLGGFVRTTLDYLGHAIRANRREDGLYHAYNLLGIGEGTLSVDRLSPMLEGQVAAISSGFLQPTECAAVLDALRRSDLYRADQQSYMLYPNRDLPGFMQKNRIPDAEIGRSQLLQTLLSDGNTSLVNRDVEGCCHFNGTFRNAGNLQAALDHLNAGPYAGLVEKESALILELYENVFNHKAFTGRSGTFFAYEGLGSIYWHMVSKLQYACLESAQLARAEQDPRTLSDLARHFVDIGKGLGVHKSPDVYGAFPTDPYSHTPWHRGAQQPGMTGQVKEDILVRFGELGVKVADGRLRFEPFLLTPGHFTSTPESIELFDLEGAPVILPIPENSLVFTVCQVPVIYRRGSESGMEIHFADGRVTSVDCTTVDMPTSLSIFERRGLVKHITVFLTLPSSHPGYAGK